MRGRLRILATAASVAALALATPALAAITVTAIGENDAAAGAATIVVTTNADCPAGSSLAMATGASGNQVVNTVVDSAGNTYTPGTAVNNGPRVRLWWSLNSKDLPNGGTITVTWAGTNVAHMASAACVSGATTFDQAGAGATGSSTSPTITTSTIGIVGVQTAVVFGLVGIANGASDTFTEASGFTGLTPALNSAAMRWAYKVVSATAAVTYAPTLGTSRAWATTYLVLKSPSPCGGLTVLGAGC